MRFNDGYKIVLTADRTLMSEYAGGIFLGFSVTMPRGVLPDGLYFSIFCPTADADGVGRVEVAPYGTRKLEAALLKHGFSREDVIVGHPDCLDRMVGPRTKVIRITTFDPLGMGPATSTFAQIFQGEFHMTQKLREILNHPSVRQFNPKIVVGGTGAWQLENDNVASELGVDHVVLGEGENLVPSLFEELAMGMRVPRTIRGGVVSEAEIPTITEPTVHGIVEIARGCGRGREFLRAESSTLPLSPNPSYPGRSAGKPASGQATPTSRGGRAKIQGQGIRSQRASCDRSIRDR
jgi:hypothetical protein